MADHGYHDLRWPVVRHIYLSYQLFAIVFFRLPFWFILSIPRSWRPRPSWDIRRSVQIRLIRCLSNVFARTGPLFDLPNHLAITPGVGVNGVWVEPCPDLVTGELKTFAYVSNVRPCRIPGYWLFKGNKPIDAETLRPDEKIVYALHGGAYIRLSAHSSDVTAAIAKSIMEHVKPVRSVFSIEYRLSVAKPYLPQNPFPAALLDALAGYNYLVNVLGIPPSSIIVEGDSAGGNLGLALVRYLVENRDNPDVKIPPAPGALVLLSPWCDIGRSHTTPGSSAYSCVNSDYIGIDRFLKYARFAFLGPQGLGAAETNRYISPASLNPQMQVSFKGFPRTFIMAGGAEMLLDQIRTLKEKMSKDMGEENVEYFEAPDGVHDYLAFDFHEPERTLTLNAIASWVSST